jgi:hypothetical protein
MGRPLPTLLLALVAGCHLETLPPPSGLAEKHDLTVVGTELRVRVRSLIAPYVGAVESVADTAAVRCPSARANTLAWKLAAVPAAQDALLQTDPLVALIDAWAYAAQLRNLLAGPDGQAALGECAAEASSQMGRLAGSAREIAAALAKTDAARADDFVERWARAHPLRSLDAPRATVAEALAGQSARQGLGALAAVGTIVESLDDLTIQVAAYRETLLKEARWTGELAALQAADSDMARRAVKDVDRFAAAADRMGLFLERLPALIDREREASFAALRDERKAAMADIDRQRVETLEAVQRGADAAVGRVDEVARASIDQGAARAESIVDHVFLRLVQLVIGLGILGVLLLLLAPRILHLRHT